MNRTILIVADNSSERALLCSFLDKEYTVISTAEGEEALKLLRAKKKTVSAVILDIIMPQMDERNILNELRRDEALSQIPIIISSGLEDEQTRERAIAYGASGFVTKPFNRALLLHTVQNVIRLHETSTLVNTLRRDKLTGLLNSDSFCTEAERIIKRHEPGYFIISCFNIDNFKLINDLFGTKNGDCVLKHIADCINDFIGKRQGLTCRYSADRFAILYPAVLKDTPDILENHALTTSPSCINRTIRIRIGRYYITDTVLPVSTMFDRAMLAENSIRGRYDTYIADYDDSMRESLVHEQQIVDSMANAVRNQEFEIWFQPQYNHSTGSLIGAEALVRWRKDGVLIQPNDFIPIFERNGMIYTLDKFVWEQVCMYLRQWLDDGKKPLPISVNVSRYDIYQPGFTEFVSGLIRKYRLPVELLRLEVTESAFSKSKNMIVEKVGALIDLGFTVEIDDFGSGYSSLNTLKDVPASILKLDMRFFENTVNSQRSGNIIESVVRMAKWLGMSVIAEGVEDLSQADYLLSIGCYYIQGYFYAKPMIKSEYEALFSSGTKEPKLTWLKTLENLNNNEFWNPKSMETLIFNSYVGGACIFEYHNGCVELLRINKHYIKEMGGFVSETASLDEASIICFLDAQNHKIAIENIEKAIATADESMCELNLRVSSHIEYIRLTARIIANAGDRYLVYCAVINMTKQHETENKEHKLTKQLETAIAKGQRYDFEFKTLLRVIPSGVLKYSADEKEEFKYINHNFISSLGYTEESFREKFHNCFREMIWHEDRQQAEQEIIIQESGGEIGKFDYRIEAADGVLHWFHDEGVKVTDDDGKMWYYVTLIDITERKETEAKLRLAEEEYRIATRHSGHTIGRYNIATKTLTITEDAATRLALPKCIEGVPYERVRLGKISPDTANDYINFYENIVAGKKEGKVTFRKLLSGQWRWMTEHSTTIFDESGKPVSAIISFVDVTNEQEKEAAYKKWQQALQNKPEDSFTLIRCNLNKNTTYDSEEGTLLSFNAYNSDEEMTFNERTRFFADQIVVAEDRSRYVSFVDSDAMLASYYRGRRADSMEFRGRLTNSKVHWLRLSIELVEYPHSTDVEAYLMFEDINEAKLAELNTRQQAETDPLTGLLNRKTFAQRLNNIISDRKNGHLTALLLIDMDGFKQVNDSFGHSVGDQVLVDAGKTMRSIVFGRDLVCRLGGDEFLICLRDMRSRDMIIKKAEQICTLTRRSFSFGIQLSISIGIAISPDDGESFDSLYNKADKALYFVKEHGKNRCAFYGEKMIKAEHGDAPCENRTVSMCNRLLVVDDNKVSRVILENVFKNDFVVDSADNGDKALEYLKAHKQEVSIILLDLMMPGMDGFEVLDKIQSDETLQAIPVIVVSGIDDRETNLRAIRCGAFDFITKPVDGELLRIRVKSAISRAENERLRIQNRYLTIQHNEMQKYRSVFEDNDTTIIEYNRVTDAFLYDSSTDILDGCFDERPLWEILRNDNIAPTTFITKLRTMVDALLNDDSRKSAKTTVALRTKNKETHIFSLKILKCMNAPFSGNELLFIFTDIGIPEK